MENNDYTKLKNSSFRQQRLPSWRPSFSPNRVFFIYQCVGVLFLGYGLLCMIISNNIKEIVIKDYESFCKNNITCIKQVTVSSQMRPPLLLYYELENFYQNHRHYVKSRSNKQLSGSNVSYIELANTKECEPIYNNSLMNKKISVTGKLLDESSPAFPCGLIAKSFFNDSFSIKVNDANIYINESNIAWEIDKKYKFKNYNLDNQWLNIEDEHFIVWMKTSPKAKFRKLWGRMNVTLHKNDNIEININNIYPGTKFGAKKNIIITEINVFGCKNPFLALFSIVIGVMISLMGIVLLHGNKYYTQRNKEHNIENI